MRNLCLSAVFCVMHFKKQPSEQGAPFARVITWITFTPATANVKHEDVRRKMNCQISTDLIAYYVMSECADEYKKDNMPDLRYTV